MPRYRKILFPGTQPPRPPAFHVYADPDDRTMTQDEQANWLEKQEKRRDKFLLDRKIQETDPDYVLTPEALDKFPMIPPRVRGYVGKAKGMRQMAFECGATSLGAQRPPSCSIFQVPTRLCPRNLRACGQFHFARKWIRPERKMPSGNGWEGY